MGPIIVNYQTSNTLWQKSQHNNCSCQNITKFCIAA